MRWLSLVLLLGCESAPVEADVSPPDSGIDASARLKYTERRAPCADRDPQRNLYWGDLHVHTALSFDAYVFDIRTRPEGSYRFAQGEPLQLPPLDADGMGTQRVQLSRPLDFAAVTDHAEYLAEIDACTTPGTDGYDTRTCIDYRAGDASSIYRFGSRLTSQSPSRLAELCGDAVDCDAVIPGVWRRVREAAEAAYDRSPACAFTSFVAYEYTAATNISNLHRNVVFRNATVPDMPLSYFDAPRVSMLWDWLDAACIDAGTGCDVLAIPHNSNWSNGNLFALPEGGLSDDALRAWAERRARLEPLVEVLQHKGDSECLGGFGSVVGEPDELCGFEKLRTLGEDCGEGTGFGAMAGLGCVSPYDFVRNVLKRGLRVWARIGVDPFAMGFIASTDTHSATAGDVAERGWKGHWGNNEDETAERLQTGSVTPGGILNNPGGLAAVWAVENSRDALFEAMRRRETYGTSGPRIAVRFFGGWGYADTLCDDPELVATAYEGGVPMGGELPDRPEGAPRFVVMALRDPEGAPLQRVQIVKGWIDGADQLAERVFEVAGTPDNGAGVDPTTCAPRGEGADTLCGFFSDPDFDPEVAAFYYARVVENPTCRWSQWECLSLHEADRPATCTDGIVPSTIQERAWTSAIWYRPS